MSVYADTHCHLDFKSFISDRSDVLKRAFDTGVERILNPGIDLASSRAALEIAESHPVVYTAVGVHPNSALTWKNTTLDELRKMTSHPKVVAIGEIGMDYYRDLAPRDVQQRVFRCQLALAAEVGLPVVIHNRRATLDLLGILTDWHSGLVRSGSPLSDCPGVLHSFSEGEDIALQASAINFYLGVSGPVTFRNAKDLHRTVSALPLDQILVETDAPFLTPDPYRGQRNEPSYVLLVAEKIAEIQSLPLENVASATTTNAGRLFNW